METIQQKINKFFDKNSKELGYKNVMQSPKITKVIVNVGTGSFKDKTKLKIVEDRIARITGQKASPRPAKQSIATFKLREGETVGYQVTLRGKRMYAFLDKLVNVALPRTKDFRGIPLTSVDQMGNYTLGIKEHTIFPETPDEEIKDVFGLAITIVTTSKTKGETEKFLQFLDFPFKKK